MLTLSNEKILGKLLLTLLLPVTCICINVFTVYNDTLIAIGIWRSILPMLFRDIVAASATVTTVLTFCTGIFICRKIIRSGHTQESSFFPLMIMFVSSVLWMKYGLLKVDMTLLFVNSIGAILSFLYVIIYFIYTSHRKFIYQQLSLGSALLFPSLFYVKFFSNNEDEALLVMGYTCASVSVISYGSPLSAIVDVIKNKSTQCMAFPLSFANCIVSAEWWLYGWLIKDLFVQVPSFLGFLLGLVQLGLFWKYPHKATSTVYCLNDD